MNYLKEELKEIFKNILSPNSTKRKESRIVLITLLISISIIFIPICIFIGESIEFSEWCVEIINCIITALMLNCVFFVLIYPLVKRMTKITKLSKNDFLKQEDYYRDLILNYDLIELSYIDNFELNKDKDIVVALINMELKGIISLKGPRIKIVNKSSKLKRTEKYILHLIKNDIMDELDIEKLKEKTIGDCIEDKLIYKINRKKIIVYLCVIFIFSIVFYIFSFVYMYYLSIFLSSLIFAIIVDPYKRTENGKKVNKQLEGLKLFIKDFSLLNEKEYKEMLFWEYYLAYSVLFGQNDKIVKEILNKIKR